MPFITISNKTEGIFPEFNCTVVKNFGLSKMFIFCRSCWVEHRNNEFKGVVTGQTKILIRYNYTTYKLMYQMKRKIFCKII